MMQSVHWSVILFYYSAVAFVTITVTYLITTEDVGRIFNYDSEQLLWIFITGTFNMIALIAKTISNQNEKSGVITMFSYVGIVYACICDFVIFDDSLNWLEWLGAAIIMTTTIALTVRLLLTNKNTVKTE